MIHPMCMMVAPEDDPDVFLHETSALTPLAWRVAVSLPFFVDGWTHLRFGCRSAENNAQFSKAVLENATSLLHVRSPPEQELPYFLEETSRVLGGKGKEYVLAQFYLALLGITPPPTFYRPDHGASVVAAAAAAAAAADGGGAKEEGEEEEEKSSGGVVARVTTFLGLGGDDHISSRSEPGIYTARNKAALDDLMARLAECVTTHLATRALKNTHLVYSEEDEMLQEAASFLLFAIVSFERADRYVLVSHYVLNVPYYAEKLRVWWMVFLAHYSARWTWTLMSRCFHLTKDRHLERVRELLLLDPGLFVHTLLQLPLVPLLVGGPSQAAAPSGLARYTERYLDALEQQLRSVSSPVPDPRRGQVDSVSSMEEGGGGGGGAGGTRSRLESVSSAGTATDTEPLQAPLPTETHERVLSVTDQLHALAFLSAQPSRVYTIFGWTCSPREQTALMCLAETGFSISLQEASMCCVHALTSSSHFGTSL